MKFELKQLNRNIPKEDLLTDLKRVATQLGRDKVTKDAYDEHGQFGSTTFIRRFGSWFEALNCAGLSKTRNLHIKDEELLADLKRVAVKLGKDRVTGAEYNRLGLFRYGTILRRFGSWFKASELVGLGKTRNLNISADELFANLADVWTRLGRQPVCADITSQTSKFSRGTYVNRFGGWGKTLEAFVAWFNRDEPKATKPSPQQAKPQHVNDTSKQQLSKRRTPRTINHRLRFLVMRRDNFKCRITGRSPATDPNVILEVDHIVPWDKGGETEIENLQTLSKEINLGKSNLDMHEQKLLL